MSCRNLIFLSLAQTLHQNINLDLLKSMVVRNICNGNMIHVTCISFDIQGLFKIFSIYRVFLLSKNVSVLGAQKSSYSIGSATSELFLMSFFAVEKLFGIYPCISLCTEPLHSGREVF